MPNAAMSVKIARLFLWAGGLGLLLSGGCQTQSEIQPSSTSIAEYRDRMLVRHQEEVAAQRQRGATVARPVSWQAELPEKQALVTHPVTLEQFKPEDVLDEVPDPARAPEFAPTVDIHAKPGYDPAELFFDPRRRWPRLRAARKVLARKLGFRALIDVIPTTGDLVRGSHGRLPEDPADGPVLIASIPGVADGRPEATELPALIEALVFDDAPDRDAWRRGRSENL